MTTENRNVGGATAAFIEIVTRENPPTALRGGAIWTTVLRT